MKEKFAQGADEKQVVAQSKERKRLDMLEKLKLDKGPQTDSDMVREYIEDKNNPDKEKQGRLELEV